MKTRIVIEIETSNLKPYEVDGEDVKDEQDLAFHNTIYGYINSIIQDELFDFNILEIMSCDSEYFNNLREFQDLGTVEMRISHDEGNTKI